MLIVEPPTPCTLTGRVAPGRDTLRIEVHKAHAKAPVVNGGTGCERCDVPLVEKRAATTAQRAILRFTPTVRVDCSFVPHLYSMLLIFLESS